MSQDYTVKIFDQFYNLDLVVNGNEYEVVYSFFRGYLETDTAAKNFTEILFRISNITQIPVMDLLQTFQAGDNLSISRTLAYYLNSISNKTVLYGVNNTFAPNEVVARNIINEQLVQPPAPVVPVADFVGTPLTGVDPLTVQFTDLSTGSPTFWQWDFQNNGSIDSTTQNPTYTYPGPGTYTVKLTVYNSNGNDEETKVDYITVTVPPAACPLPSSIPDDSTIDLWHFDEGLGETVIYPTISYPTTVSPATLDYYGSNYLDSGETDCGTALYLGDGSGPGGYLPNMLGSIYGLFDDLEDGSVEVSFAIMNPGFDNGPLSYDSYSPTILNIQAILAGEFVYQLYAIAVTGGFWLTTRPGDPFLPPEDQYKEFVFIPLVDYAWTNIKISLNPFNWEFNVYQDEVNIYTNYVWDIPGWYSGEPPLKTWVSFALDIYGGSRYAIDELQRSLPTP